MFGPVSIPCSFVLVVIVVGLGTGCASPGLMAPDQSVVRIEDPTERIERHLAKLQRYPDLYPVWARLGGAYLHRARATGNVADFSRAEHSLSKSLAIQVSAEALRWLAAVKLDQHRFDEAIKLAQRALEADPGDGIARAVVGDALLALGKYQAAREVFERLKDEQMDFYSNAGFARYLFLTGDPNSAIARLQDALAKLPDQPGPYRNARAWCHLMIGSYLFELGNAEASLEEYKTAIKLRPDSIDILEHRTEWEATYGDPVKAVAMYQRILHQQPRPLEQVALGDILIRIGRVDEGMRYLEQAETAWKARLAKGDVSVRRDLALLLLDYKRDVKLALDLAREDFDIRGDVLAYDTLAWALFMNGEYEKARQAIKEASRYGTPLRMIAKHKKIIESRDYRCLGL